MMIRPQKTPHAPLSVPEFLIFRSYWRGLFLGLCVPDCGFVRGVLCRGLPGKLFLLGHRSR